MNKSKDFNLIVKVNHTCNMHCDYCYYLRKEDNLEKGKMTFETASQMIKSILDYNTNSVRFMWHGGEPLLSGLDMFDISLAK